MESRGLSLMTALSVFGASATFAQTDTFDSDRLGVWTKADSVTAFDDFSYGSAGK